ncbi:MAG: CsgG/HfaB family protein [Thiohalomonadaceae bacterium]
MKTAAIATALLTATALPALANTTVSEVKIPVVKCSAPVHSLAIAQVDCTAASCGGSSGSGGGMAALAALMSGSGGVQAMGDGVRSMLSNALRETGCFKVVDLDRFEKTRKMMESTGQKVKPPKIDHIVTAEITAIDIQRSGGSFGGGLIPIVGAISTNKQSARMSLDVAVIDPTTLEVGQSKTFAADSSKNSFGVMGLGFGKGMLAGGGWSVSNSVELDTVVREVVFHTANYLAETYAAKNIIERPVVEEQPAASAASSTTNPFLDSY